eukprot:9563194-Lingulodinium_polyedra.AAC.1
MAPVEPRLPPSAHAAEYRAEPRDGPGRLLPERRELIERLHASLRRQRPDRPLPKLPPSALQ